MSGEIAIRRAGPADAALVHALVIELAAYERLSHAVEATEADLSDALFAPNPRVFAEILSVGGTDAGLALWFHTFSTFLGRHGIWLEDLYVRPAFRRRGLARAAFRHLAEIAARDGLGRLEWSVLDWNAPALAFYRTMGARPVEGWTTMRVTGSDLDALACGGGADG